MIVLTGLLSHLDGCVMDPADSDSTSTSAIIWAAIVPAGVLLYFVFLRHTSTGPTPGFSKLRVRPPGAGKAGGAWSIVRASTDDGGGDGGSGDDGGGQGIPVENGDGVSWLGDGELRALEAICDTLLPGFEVGSREDADATVDQVRITCVRVCTGYDVQ